MLLLKENPSEKLILCNQPANYMQNNVGLPTFNPIVTWSYHQTRWMYDMTCKYKYLPATTFTVLLCVPPNQYYYSDLNAAYYLTVSIRL